MSAPTPRERYRDRVADLAAPLTRRIADRDAAQRALVAGKRDLSRRLTESARRITEADGRVSTARRRAADTDEQAARIWRDLTAHCRRPPRGLGPMPTARPVGPDAPPADELLRRARATLAAARRGELPMPAPLPTPTAMLLTGVLGAAVLAGAGAALASAAGAMHGTEQTVVTLLSGAVRVLSPAGGVAAGLGWLARYGLPLAARAGAVLVPAALVAGYGLSALLWWW